MQAKLTKIFIFIQFSGNPQSGSVAGKMISGNLTVKNGRLIKRAACEMNPVHHDIL